MMNPKKAAKRLRSWIKLQAKKAARQAEQKRREAVNRELRSQGLPTPYEAAKIAAKLRKASQ